jgi:hypothetical protein
LEDFGDSEY